MSDQIPFRVLIVDDDVGLNRLIRRRLKKIDIQSTGAHNATEALQLMDELSPDLILLDQKLPDSTGVELVYSWRQIGLEFPFIAMTGNGDERVAVELMKLGARDYLTKSINLLDLLPQVIENVKLEIQRESRLQQMEIDLETHENRFKTYVEQAPNGIFLAQEDGRLADINPSAQLITGYSREELLGKTILDLTAPVDLQKAKQCMRELEEKGKSSTCLRFQKKGSQETFSWTLEAIKLENGSCIGFVTDITERIRAEKLQAAQLRLIKASGQQTVQELLKAFLDEAESLTESCIGFYNFVDKDQEHVSLQALSSATIKAFGEVFDSAQSHPISREGVWEQCIKYREPVLNNDLASLSVEISDRHAALHRELVVPVLREHRIVALLGVANKATPYHQGDVTSVQQLADIAWETVERKQAQEELKKNQYYLAKSQEMGKIGTWDLDLKSNKLTWTLENYHVFGVEPGTELTYELFLECVHPDDREKVAGLWQESLATLSYDIEHRLLVGDQVKWVREKADFELDETGKPVRAIGITQDITSIKHAEEERLTLQEQLRHTQKMEAIGTLAGGVAHDFNNLLAVISGFTELSIQNPNHVQDLEVNLREIQRAADRAGDLTRQLLAFSRKQTIKLKSLNLNSQIEELWKMLQRIVGEDIQLERLLCSEILTIRADPGQLQQIFMNMVINAAYALRNHPSLRTKRISIETSTVSLKTAPTCMHCHQSLEEGPYAKIVIADTGPGIEGELRQKIFDPFFTTKKFGSGTGLGLSTVYGIVKQNEGHVCLNPGVKGGASFTILWPLSQQKDGNLRQGYTSTWQSGDASILIVEDEPQLLSLGEKILSRAGYKVILASSGEEAIQLMDDIQHPIDLLFTDVILPGIDGVDCARHFLKSHPEGTILFTSGYADDRLQATGLDIPNINLISKPYNAKALTTKVHALLKGVE